MKSIVGVLIALTLTMPSVAFAKKIWRHRQLRCLLDLSKGSEAETGQGRSSLRRVSGLQRTRQRHRSHDLSRSREYRAVRAQYGSV